MTEQHPDGYASKWENATEKKEVNQQKRSDPGLDRNSLSTLPMSSDTVFEAAAVGDVEYLKKHKSKLSEKNERGWTPLHFAARYGQAEAVTFIMSQSNCDQSAVNSEGKTAFQVAEFWGFDQVANLLRPNTQAPAEANDQDKPIGSPFPKNRVNFFAGSPLNRCSWLRNDNAVLKKLATSPRSRYIAFSNLDPLFNDEGLYFANYDQLKAVVDRSLAFGSLQETGTTLVFLGIDEREGKGDAGVAYWAIDLTPQGANESEFKALAESFESQHLEFSPALPRAFVMDKAAASILGQARAMVDWNIRNLYCPACGQKTVSGEGGHKRVCLPVPNGKTCISNQGVQNVSYPRTDPVVIVCIVHPTEDKILLGRQARWPGRMHSCIAGFVEAGESIEEAVRREAFEETGIIVDRVAYHSSQPWPFPNSLMFGFIAEAVNTDIKLEDKELERAVWFTRAEVLAALKGEPGAPLSLPPGGAIASKLIKTWATEAEWSSGERAAKM